MRSAATMDVDTTALHHTQVRYEQSGKSPKCCLCDHIKVCEYLLSVFFVSGGFSEARSLRSAPGDPHVCRVLLSWWTVSRRAEVLQDDLRPRLQRAMLIEQPAARLHVCTCLVSFMQQHRKCTERWGNVSCSLFLPFQLHSSTRWYDISALLCAKFDFWKSEKCRITCCLFLWLCQEENSW